MTGPKKRLIMTKGRKTGIISFFLAALMLAFFSSVTVHGNNVKLKTYIVYDSPARFGSSFPLVTALTEYLGHFDLACQAMPLAAWQPGVLQDAELVVYVGLKDITLPQGLLQEMARVPRVIWFEKNIEQMAACLNWQDFELEGVANGWSYIDYRKELLFSDWMNVVITQPGQKAQVLATVKNVTNSKPLAWQRDNVYFCGFLDVDRYFMSTLGNLLHQFIPNNHQSHSHSVLLRIEDVSPLVSPQAVSDVIAAIDQYRIPFAIGVIPVGVTEDDKHIYLHDKQELVKVLKEAQDNGASIIMHGYTHQNAYSPKTGEGYEFWNARDDKPMENDEAFTSERIEAGIAELVRSGLIPVAFEPPHYAMSEAGYKVLSRYFNIFSGEIQISDKSAQISLALPYAAESAYLNGMLVIPENMGYYDGKGFLVEDMLHNSAQILDIQDGFACFFYHGYLPPDKIGSIIEGVQKQGYEFFDLRRLPIHVQSSQVNIRGQNGQMSVAIDAELQAAWENTLVEGNFAEKAGTVHVVVLLTIISMFVLIIIRLKANANKYYER
ncbi:MAG: hypothetical protein K0R22_2578 [Sporomusa sp.]|nr:hypothetical protein [Sporomusa sp.]